jgi:DNA-binding NtrC family response regulator
MQRTRLLCVGLDPRTRLSYERTFRRCGYDVHSTSRPSKALKRLRENGNNIDIVICGYDPPGISGAELSAEMKRINPLVHVILVSGSQPMLEDASHFVDAAVPEGTTAESLLNKVRGILNSRRDEELSSESRGPLATAVAGILVAGVIASKLLR